MIPHFAAPLVLTTRGSLGALAQDSPLEVATSVGLLLDTRPGERRSVPSYGLSDPLFRGIDPDEVYEVVAEWEPRAQPTDLDLDPDGLAPAQVLTVYPAAPPA